MATEIERKFLVVGDAWRGDVVDSVRLRQAYLATTDAASVRVRIIDEATAFLTIKSALAGRVRDEFEYPIPVADARQMIELRTGAPIEKIRYKLPCDDGDLVVDEFLGENAGLVIAEIELPEEGAVPALPGWIGREITEDRRFYNASLAGRPFADWPAEERDAASG